MTLVRREQTRDRSGFTLMEMLVVVAIIVALAGVGGYYFMQAADKAKVDIARTKAKTTLTDACKTYWLDHNNQWPQSLDELVVGNDGKAYLDDAEAIIDPWGQKYTYDPSGGHNNGRKPDIYTTNPGTGEQIGNW